MGNYNSEFETSIFWSGTFVHEQTSVEIWNVLSRNSVTVLDVGANSGFYSLISGSVNSVSHVVAFEPIDRIRKRLNQNIRMNDLGVVVEPFGVSNKVGTARIFDLPNDHHYHASLVREEVSHHVGLVATEIPIVSIDEYCNERLIHNVDLVKIDVEGHEVEVIEGMLNVLRRDSPSILLEVKSEENAKRIAELLVGLQYQFFEIQEGVGIREVQTLSQSLRWNSLLLGPKHSLESRIDEFKRA